MKECSPSSPRVAILILLCVVMVAASGCWRKKHHYVYMPTPAPVTKPISIPVLGAFHSCNLQPTGQVKCWGYNVDGQLGQGDQIYRGDVPNQMGENLLPIDFGSGRTVMQLVAGISHTCALLDNGVTKCWGANWVGQLGLGDTVNRGDVPNQMGDNLPAVDFGTGRTAVTLAAGSSHTCAILDNSSVKCWGYNPYGQLGLGDTEYRGYVPGQMGDNLPTVDFGTGRTAVAIEAGELHTCALLEKAVNKSWGGTY
jgi:alpha-tubulin suppressor-like RCC1 family protein